MQTFKKSLYCRWEIWNNFTFSAEHLYPNNVKLQCNDTKEVFSSQRKVKNKQSETEL